MQQKDNPLHTRAVLILVVLSYAMIVLDISIVLTALPRLKADLGFSDAGLTWVSSIYTLFFGGFLLLGGKLGDLYGRRRIYMIGLSIFALASLAIGSAQSAGFIVAARAVQGMGAAILAPSTLSLLQVTFPREKSVIVPLPGMLPPQAFQQVLAWCSAACWLI